MVDDQGETQADLKVAENAERWHLLALIYGYNELAKVAEKLGEKVYCRLARDQYESELKTLGTEIVRTPDDKPAVLVLSHRMPYVKFDERDIELMRVAIQEYDAKNPR